MRRWHAERQLMLRRWRMEIAKHEQGWSGEEGYSYCALAPLPPTPGPDSCHCYRGPGSMRKRTPYDCGNPRCGLCHHDKFYTSKNRANVKRAAIRRDLDAYGG